MDTTRRDLIGFFQVHFNSCMILFVFISLILCFSATASASLTDGLVNFIRRGGMQ